MAGTGLGTVALEPNAAGIRYGKELIANTAEYLGPNGKVRAMSNGMNCQNCRLQAGTLPLGNNYSAVNATYPKMRARSGQVEDTQKRTNDCLERNLNRKPLDRESNEMNAMAACINWVGKDVPKNQSPKGAGLYELPLLDRAADPAKGKLVYEQNCQACHGAEGQGLPRPDVVGAFYPRFGERIAITSVRDFSGFAGFAGFVKANMPFGATYEDPVLSDEEAWDVAAYVNSLERPGRDLSMDWPDISKKPMDHPFGPFSDSFSETQHKFGPFLPIQESKSK